MVNNQLTDIDDCVSKLAICNGSVYKLIGNFSDLQTDILRKLFSRNCCSFNSFTSCCSGEYLTYGVVDH